MSDEPRPLYEALYDLDPARSDAPMLADDPEDRWLAGLTAGAATFIVVAPVVGALAFLAVWAEEGFTLWGASGESSDGAVFGLVVLAVAFASLPLVVGHYAIRRK